MGHINKISIKDMAKNQRPREKIILNGVNSLSDAELLAILLRTGNKNMSSIELANCIINMDKSLGLKKLADTNIEDLKEIKGVGTAKACQIMAAIELGRRIARFIPDKKPKITSPDDVVDMYMEDIRYLKKEVFKAILLNTKNEIICDVEISVGTLNSSLVHPREVFIEAIKRSTNKIILMHNHPSGNPEPSREDKNITNRLIEGGKILGIDIIDHIIVGDGVYFSFKEKALI